MCDWLRKVARMISQKGGFFMFLRAQLSAQMATDKHFIIGDGRAGCPLKAGATAEVRLSDQVVKLITFGKADQFQAIDQKIRSRR
jgi:NAD+ kinase